MIRRKPVLSAAFCVCTLSGVLAAVAQEQDAETKAILVEQGVIRRDDQASRDLELAEDLEIMGQLVSEALDELYPQQGVVWGLDADPKGRPIWWQRTRPRQPLANWQPSQTARLVDRARDVLSAYLQDHGAVFQLEAPPLRQAAEEPAAAAARKPLSRWEQARRRLRGEEVKESQAGVWKWYSVRVQTNPSAPTKDELVDTLLDVLAENGPHFRHLAAHERLTVAITFRPTGAGFAPDKYWPNVTAPFPSQGTATPQSGTRALPESVGSGAALADFDSDGLLDLYLTNPDGANTVYRNLGEGKFEDVTNAAGADASALGAGQTSGVGVEDVDQDGDLDLVVQGNQLVGRVTEAQRHPGEVARTEANTHELSGDLYMRQRDYKKAVEAYETALREVLGGQDPYHNIYINRLPLYLKLAQAHVGAGNYTKGQGLLGTIASLKLSPNNPNIPLVERGLQAPDSAGTDSQVKRPMPLPGRLIVSVLKSHVDGLANGAISRDVLKQQASVHYLEPPAPPQPSKPEPAQDQAAPDQTDSAPKRSSLRN